MSVRYLVFLRLGLVVLLLHLLGLVLIVGEERLRQFRRTWRTKGREVLPVLGALGLALVINNYARQIGPDISWIIGVEVTDVIYRLEGDFVVWLQSFASFPVTTYFSYMYIYGYAFLLTFPLLAYLTHRDTRPVRTLLWAYLFNYMLGLVIYLVIIAYGPRNNLPHLVEPLLYSTFPEYAYITREVNRSVNVFPSLHTSLSMTVLFVAMWTRRSFPRWLPVAAVFALSITVSTMYLGIHWASDVVAGIALAGVSVVLGIRIVEGTRLNLHRLTYRTEK